MTKLDADWDHVIYLSHNNQIEKQQETEYYRTYNTIEEDVSNETWSYSPPILNL